MPIISITFLREEVPEGRAGEVAIEDFLRALGRHYGVPWTVFKDGNEGRWPKMKTTQVPMKCLAKS